MRHWLSTIKTILVTAIIVLVLYSTGLMPYIAQYSQSAVMSVGLFNAGDEETSEPLLFDYNFTIKNLNEKSIAVDQFKNKVVFLNLWATWCGPCRAEMPTIQKLFASTDTSQVAFVMLSIDREKDKPKVVSYINDKRFTFPVYTLDGPVPDMLKVPSIPTTFVVAKDGRIVAQEIGTTNFNTPRFKKFLEKLRNE